MPSERDVRGLSRYVDEEQRLREDEGHVVKQHDIDPLSLPTERQYEVSRLTDFPGIAFFTLGPLYVALNIEFDILETFAADTGVGRFERHTIYFGHPIVAGLKEWSFILQGIPEPLAVTLYRYLDTQTILNRGSNLYSVFQRRNVTLPDPFAVDRKEMTAGEPPARIVAYVPSTNRYRLDFAERPLGPEPVSLRLLRLDPQPDIVATGNALLTTE